MKNGYVGGRTLPAEDPASITVCTKVDNFRFRRKN